MVVNDVGHRLKPCRRAFLSLTCVLGLFFLAATAVGEEKAEPDPVDQALPPRVPSFAPGERLTYALRWNKIYVGTFSVFVEPMTTLKGRRAWHFSFKASTNDLGDKVYKVRNYIHSYVSPDLYRSYKYVSRQRHAGESKWVILTYDWDKNKVHYKKNAEDRGWRPIKPNTVDPLALFYAVRCTDLADKDELVVRVGDGKTCMDSRAKIVRKETVKLANGKKYTAYLVEPELTGLRGVFEKSDDATLQIWITADKRRIPVRISSKVIVGRFFADLIKYQAPPKKAAAKAAEDQ